MYVVCNHTPGPSVLGVPDPRRTNRLRVNRQNPNSQSPHTSKNVQNLSLSPTTSSQWYNVYTQIRIKQHTTEITYNIDHIAEDTLQLFRTVRGGTRCSSPSIVFTVWKRSSNCRHFNTQVSAQVIEVRGHRSRWS